ncbi:MAG: 3-dehydroquinate synthase family protein [Candidatus Cloacimonadales bacterium]
MSKIATKILESNDWLMVIESYKKKVLVIDQKVYALISDEQKSILACSPFFIFEANESNKNFEQYQRILSFFYEEKVSRDYQIIAVGGGITCDITAFAASTFKRGCQLVFVPTTLLAMVDAAIGGKTAINFRSTKNCIGSFYPAAVVIIDLAFLETLELIDKKNGLTEILKIALLENSELLQAMQNTDFVIDYKIIKQAIDLKLEYCEEDLYDNGKRQLLNLGHTIAHLIESNSRFTVSHGEAVAYGLSLISKICLQRQQIDRNYYNQIDELLAKHNLKQNLEIDLSKEEILKQILHDKKNRENLSLPMFSGAAVKLLEIEVGDFAEILSEYFNK